MPRMNRWIKQIPTEKQTVALLLDHVRELFYGGAGGGGKTVYLLMAASQYLDVPGYAAVIFRNKFTDLNKPDGLIPKSHEWWANEPDAHWDGSQHQWTFSLPGGGKSVLAFGFLDGPYDQFSHQSSAYQFIGIDEATNVRQNQALYMFTRLRKLVGSEVPLRFRVCSNPPAREQVAKGAWVKERYVVKSTRKKGVVFIPAHMEDNPYLDVASYKESLANTDPVTRRQIELGDWDVQAKGRMVEREWFQLVKDVPTGPLMRWVRAWDLASTAKSKEGHDPDWTAGVLLGRTLGLVDDPYMGKVPGGMIFVRHAVRWRENPGRTEGLLRTWADRDGLAVPIWMEQEPGSSGKIATDHYRRNVLPGFAFNAQSPQTAKHVRYAPFAGQAEAGNVFVLEAPWTREYLDSAELFPDGAHDDWEDATSLAYSKVTGAQAFVRRC